MGEAVLEADAIAFTAGGKPILKGVSVALEPRETLALLGPSGCGKTTLLRIIAGLEQPTSGRVFLNGRDVTGLPPNRRGLGMMFQDYALFPHMDVARNIAFGLRHSALPRSAHAARMAEMLRLVGLEGYERRTIEALSGGERQRVALARTLAPQPLVLLLDEPLGALDRVLRDQLTVELRAILGVLDASTIYVTHDQAEAFGIATRVLLMDAGRIVREGTPEEIYREPRTPFVARFLGMDNMAPATWDGDWWQTTIGRWRVARAEANRGLLLLRPDGAIPVEAPGDGVVSGRLLASVFQGATVAVRLDTAAGVMQFRVPAGASIPTEGEAIHVLVPDVQLLDEGSDDASATEHATAPR